MKNLIAILLLLGSAALAAAQTAVPTYYNPTALSYTNGWADNSTNSTASGVLEAKRDNLISWQVSFKLNGAGTAVNYFDFERSLDNTNWPGVYFQTVALAANGTATVSTNVLLDLEGMGYFRLARARFGNNSGSYTTNLLHIYTPKPNLR